MARPLKSEAEVKPIVEAILFSADRPLPAAKISRAVEGADVRIVRKCIEQLNKEYEENNKPYQIEEIAGGFQLLTKPEFWKWVSKFRQTRSDGKLSPATLETLAIVAYKQPVLRADVEAIRGVQSGEVLRGILERGLIKVVGRQDTIGRPILYGTTSKFLEQLGLKTIKDLPRAGQLGAQRPAGAPPQPPPSPEGGAAAPDAGPPAEGQAQAGLPQEAASPEEAPEQVEAVDSPAPEEKGEPPSAAQVEPSPEEDHGDQEGDSEEGEVDGEESPLSPTTPDEDGPEGDEEDSPEEVRDDEAPTSEEAGTEDSEGTVVDDDAEEGKKAE